MVRADGLKSEVLKYSWTIERLILLCKSYIPGLKLNYLNYRLVPNKAIFLNYYLFPLNPPLSPSTTPARKP